MPTNITIKAREILAAYMRGEVRPIKRPRFNTHYLVFKLGYAFRLLCLNPGDAKNPNSWQLVTHERYSSLIAKRP